MTNYNKYQEMLHFDNKMGRLILEPWKIFHDNLHNERKYDIYFS